MNKYFLGLITGIAVLPVSFFPSLVNAQSCANYWVNPKTGKQECLTVTQKPSFQYLGKVTRINKDTKKRVTTKFYVEKGISVANGLSKPLNQVTILSTGHRFENIAVVDCNNQAIAYKTVSTKLNGKLLNIENYENLEFEAISDIVDVRTYNYICKNIIPKN